MEGKKQSYLQQYLLSPVAWKSSFKMMVAEHLIRIKQELHQPIKQWIDSL
jgi:hypothetical protein